VREEESRAGADDAATDNDTLVRVGISVSEVTGSTRGAIQGSPSANSHQTARQRARQAPE
jgi:hypothetical protein